jgi:signal transduction histidine kinase
MNTTLRKHLQRQTLALVLIAYVVCLLVLFCGSLFQNYSMQVETILRLKETSKSQIDLLLPSFLLPEQSSGKELLLKKFQKEEQLSAIKLQTKDDKLPNIGNCQYLEGIKTCRQLMPSKISLAVPIKHGDITYGYLVKFKNIDSGVLEQNFLPIAGVVAIGLLFVLVGIIFVVVRLTNFEIPNAIEVLLSDIRSCIESDGENKHKNFRFQEFAELSDEIYHLIAKARENQKAAAVAQMTQHLAHDVRKPFSMLKTGLILLRTTNDPREFQNKLGLLTSEVERATKSVDGMLSDVMEVGSTSGDLIKEAVSPTTLIEMTLGEAFRIYPKSDISVIYDLQHVHMVDVHVKKVLRVFSNIVGNAIQAMKAKGTLWFKTSESHEYLEFRIGNVGSLIPLEHLPKLFEAFFTSGKKGGTGLGLAIAKKVVTAHGGTIYCESQSTSEYPNGYVEFIFTLPKASHLLDITTANLPKHSFEITKIIQSALMEPTDSKVVLRDNSSDIVIINEINSLLLAHVDPLGVLFVDDESIYRSGLSSWIEDTNELKTRIKIHHAKNSDQALKIVGENPIDLIVTDIDMGPNSLNGFDLVNQLRTKKCLLVLSLYIQIE